MSRGCTSESHPLFATFMTRLSSCIFEWDEGDYSALFQAKKREMEQAGIPDPSLDAVRKAITREELAKHCRRKTRGAEKTVELIESLLLTFSTVTDSLGVPLLREDMKTMWEEHKVHIPCLQDPPHVQLYVITSHLTKGGIRLPVLRCARGTTSLESFHLHLQRFIPGSRSNAVNFQAYFLEGITRYVVILILLYTCIHVHIHVYNIHMET